MHSSALPGTTIASGLAGIPSLRKIASQASLRPRSPDERGGSLDSAAGMRHSCSFDSKRLNDHLHPLAAVAPVAAMRLGEATVTIRNGSLMLPAGALLLLENSSVVFEDVSIRGPAPDPDASTSGKSLPLVYVTGATVTLTRCSVGPSNGHGIGVGDSAAVTLAKCEVSNHRTYGVAVRGSGASAHAADCTFESNGQDGVAVGAGAAAELQRCVLSHNTMLGLCVSAGAKAVVEECVLERNGTHGLSAQGGADLSATGCRISDCEVGVLALDALTAVTVTDCDLLQNEHGVHARDGVQVRCCCRLCCPCGLLPVSSAVHTSQHEHFMVACVACRRLVHALLDRPSVGCACQWPMRTGRQSTCIGPSCRPMAHGRCIAPRDASRVWCRWR